MKEYMLLIRNATDGKTFMNDEEHLAFIRQCEIYIDLLKSQNKLIAAQPLIREGVVLSKSRVIGISIHCPPIWSRWVIIISVLKIWMEAIEIAKNNPEFEYVSSASIEVRPIKTKEAETQFVYPTKG
jgi:hypothetical protein